MAQIEAQTGEEITLTGTSSVKVKFTDLTTAEEVNGITLTGVVKSSSGMRIVAGRVTGSEDHLYIDDDKVVITIHNTLKPLRLQGQPGDIAYFQR